MKNSTALHDEDRGREIWDGRYKDALSQAKADYKNALSLYWAVSANWKEYADSLFGVTEVSPIKEYQRIREGLINTAMTYASTLFSAIFSPLAVAGLRNREEMFYVLREVLSELGKFDTKIFTSSQKEVLIACALSLGEHFSKKDLSKGFYNALARKLVYEVLADTTASLATRMLVLARASLMRDGMQESSGEEAKKRVVNLLETIKKDPSKIESLGQGWKTYVRLSRMVFSWKHMFFGLKHDKSQDLRVKSCVYFLRYFYK